MLKQESSSGKKRLIGHTASSLTLNISVPTYTQSQQKQNNSFTFTQLSFTFISFPFPTSSLLCLLIGKKGLIIGVGGVRTYAKCAYTHLKSKRAGEVMWEQVSQRKVSPLSPPPAPAPAPHSAWVAASLVRPLRPTPHMHCRVSRRRLCLMDKAYAFFSKARDCLEFDACRTVHNNWNTATLNTFILLTVASVPTTVKGSSGHANAPQCKALWLCGTVRSISITAHFRARYWTRSLPYMNTVEIHTVWKFISTYNKTHCWIWFWTSLTDILVGTQFSAKACHLTSSWAGFYSPDDTQYDRIRLFKRH